MCEKCDAALLAAANAALMLASAAEKLYDINQHKESATLAKAAAELFERAQDEVKPGDTGTASKGSPEAAAPDDVKPVRPFHVADDGTVYVNGVAIGRAVLVSRPTLH